MTRFTRVEVFLSLRSLATCSWRLRVVKAAVSGRLPPSDLIFNREVARLRLLHFDFTKAAAAAASTSGGP